MTATLNASEFETVAELIHHLGDIDPSRIRLHPKPGTATEKDLLKLQDHSDRIYELVDGTLVEKVMGYEESSLTMRLGYFLQHYLQHNDLGNLAGADGAMRLMPGLVRVPDLSFILWERLGGGPELSTTPIVRLGPDLAIEVLSKGNTPKEMKRKTEEYFLSGAHLVWLVDPAKRIVQVATAPDSSVTLTEEQTLDGGDVLPGFTLPLSDLFARVPRRRPGSKRRPKGKK